MKRLLALGLAGAAWAAAQELSLEFDAAKTAVHYSVVSSLHTVRGTFKLKRGHIDLDAASGRVSGLVVVDAASGSSGNDARDSRMHSNVLESARYPEVTFKPQRVDGKVAVEGVSQVTVHGVFGIHGAEHDLAVPTTVQMTGEGATVTLHFAVPYTKWGMKNPGNFLLRVKDTVDIEVKAAAAVRVAAHS